jgi:1-pyrroline-5-carboxylate dehydrogenase
MSNGFFSAPPAQNEPIKSYIEGSSERRELRTTLSKLRSTVTEIPLVLGDQKIMTPQTGRVVSPHAHRTEIARHALATEEHVNHAIQSAVKTQREWSSMPWWDRAAIFLKAADLLSGPYRAEMNAATMMGQSKTIFQAEIDAACELADFWRFNVAFMERIYKDQPLSAPGTWNRVSYRGLEGFVFAVTPFNFTSVALNLASSPALMGSTVVWKPAHTALLANWVGLKILEEAGLPPGVINLVMGDAQQIGHRVLRDRDLAGIHFTGSTNTFNTLWSQVGQNISHYRTYPRVVGETGGKDFIIAHPSADLAALETALIRGAFEYQGQKCSAASRAYIPTSIWKKIKEPLLEKVSALKVGSPENFANFLGAVIDENAFNRIHKAIENARHGSDAKILVGGEANREEGYFIRPTIIEAAHSDYVTMREELFGPVLTVFVFDDRNFDQTLAACESTSPYGLTGAIFAQDRRVISDMTARLEHAAGNFYINDKPTGAMVGQQPFGGGRASGTNDKAGSYLNLLRWTSVRTLKETFVPPKSYGYPFMEGNPTA